MQRFALVFAWILLTTASTACSSDDPIATPLRDASPADSPSLDSSAIDAPEGRDASVPSDAGPAPRPNFVVILTDDMDVGLSPRMPKVQADIAAEGVTFTRSFLPVSLCCPSRSSFLTGQYPHNHQILGNDAPYGGFARFRDLGRERSTLATWLQAAGYRTVMLGKYLNGYPTSSDPNYVPPGWTEWYAIVGHYYDYRMVANGTSVEYGRTDADYETEVLAARAIDFLSRSESDDDVPFFMYLAPHQPHKPATPPRRYRDDFADERIARTESFNEADVSDKPAWVRALPLLSADTIASFDEQHRDRLRTLEAVDDMVDAIVSELEARGELDHTYIVFASDNGYHMGQHRLDDGKNTAYEEDLNIPLIIRGPGAPRGETRDHMVLNIDYAPTIMALAGLEAPASVDGQSLVPLLGASPPPIADWRQDFLIEHVPDGDRTFIGLRTRSQTYVEYASGERELYDLDLDPLELDNAASTADSMVLRALGDRIEALRTCAGPSCRRLP